MKLFLAPRTGLRVELRTRDEHCPPHVHVQNDAVPSEARLAFSFIATGVRLMDVDPIEGMSTTKTIDRIKAAIANSLRTRKAEWWVEGQYVPASTIGGSGCRVMGRSLF